MSETIQVIYCETHHLLVRWETATNCAAGAFTGKCVMVERRLVSPTALSDQPVWEQAHRLQEAIFDTFENWNVENLVDVHKVVLDAGVVQSWVRAALAAVVPEEGGE